MKSITIQDIKTKGSKVLKTDDGVPILLIVNSKPQGVFLGLDEYESMIEMLEDYEDYKAIEDRKNDPSEDWDVVQKRLGWTVNDVSNNNNNNKKSRKGT